MPWIELIDGALWLVTLLVSMWLGWVVYRRRDLSTRLFLGMVAALVVLQLRNLLGIILELGVWLFPGAIEEHTSGLVQSAWPVDIAAVVVFGCLTLHLFLVFPTQSRVIRAWRWSPLLFYLPGMFLAAMMLTHLTLGSERYMAFWGLDRLGFGDDTLQLLFIILTVWTALVRLLLIYFSRATPLVRQRLAWILWGLIVGGCLVLLTDYGPDMAGLPRPIISAPGIEQLPILIILGSFALAILRYHVFDVVVVINRSVVYSALIVAITVLYLAFATVLGSLFQSLSADVKLPLVAVLTTLVVVLVALPLRDAIQRGVDRLFLRYRADYHQLLQDYSRSLTTLATLPHLLTMIAEQLEEVFHPSGLSIVLADGESSYSVMFSRGKLASHPLWQEGAHFATGHFVPSRLAIQHRPFYLPWHTYDVPAHQKKEWKELEDSGAHVFIPMRLRDSLVGWLVLGPRLSELSYTRQDLDFLSALADQSCVALENARLYGQMRQRVTELGVLATVSSAISLSLDLERVLQTIVESVVQVIGCDKSAIFELSEDGTDLSLRTAKGLSQTYIQNSRHLRMGEDNRALTTATRESLIVPDIQTDPRLVGLAELAAQEGFRAMADVPLVGREGPLGVLSVYFAHVHEPSASELEMLATFANHAAIAIENARLYAAVTRERDRATRLYERTDAVLARRVEELTTIEEISRQLTSTLDLQRVMDLVLERALQATGVERGIIALYERDQGVLRLLAQEGYPSEADRYLTEPWPADRGITGRVARSGALALVPDVSHDPDYADMAPTSRSQLSVPIVHEGQVIGVITLESDRLTAFTSEHVRFAELLADHAAIGIHNAQLFQQVREGRDRLQSILNSTHDAVFVLDTTGQIILANPRVRELFGPEAERWLRSVSLLDELQRSDSAVSRWTDLSAASLMQLADRTRDCPDQAVDIVFNFQDGDRQCYVEGTASSVLSATGEVLGWVVILRDMTRQQELEQFREDLTSMVIHNLQGPLAALISSLETLREDDQIGSDMADQLLHIALTSGQKLYNRIESVLWMRRLEDKQVPLDLQALSLPGVVRMVVEEYLPMATAVGVSLETVFAQDLPLVMVDEEIIGRVFSNLLDNAFKYTPEGGHIQVRVTLEGSSGGFFALCAVTDTGPGISENLKEAVFGKFRRGDKSHRGRRGGMGIGLHYCKLAVEAHGGRIWVESEKGRGTTFYFTLPVDAGGSA